MSGPEFKAWPKTPRLFRDMVITEKIDGTNSAIIIEPETDGGEHENWTELVLHDGLFYNVAAQSRSRIITPGKSTDNFGFAAWVQENAKTLVALLGPGTHYGEYWGKGIQRGYGIDERRFSLFNADRYQAIDVLSDGLLGVVPTLYVGPFSTNLVLATLDDLLITGSRAAPGFMKPEGVVVYHTAARSVFKVLAENDDRPKGE